VNEIQRYAAALAICGFSTRMTELFELDRREDEAPAAVPPQRRPS
jgi:hypothetical protein